jgi:hypothetical protein
MLIGRYTSSAISLRGQRNPELPLEPRSLLLPCRTRASEHGFEALPWILEGRVSLLCEVGICDDAVEFVGGRSVTTSEDGLALLGVSLAKCPIMALRGAC